MRTKHVATLITALAVAIATPAYAAAESDPKSRPLVDLPAVAKVGKVADTPSAEQVLDQVTSLLSAGTANARSTVNPDDTHMTLLLRQLALRADELEGADRKAARAVLARPTGGVALFGVKYRSKAKNKCSRHLCVHWVTKGEDKPSLRDGKDRDKLPEWVETNIKTAEYVWKRQVTKAGYRAPRTDTRSKENGPNKKLDIYLANLGDNGLYGFCATDDPRRGKSRSVSAYCVIDNNFSRREFGTKPIKALQATVAHEFFHAVQYAYDWRDDAWLLEGTAAWIEDQVYDSINDNRQYLGRNSPLTAPEIPLDAFYLNDEFSTSPPAARYGVWTFFQFLGERYPARSGGMPVIVRDIWKYADNATNKKPKQYSTQAVNTVLTQRGSSFAQAFAHYSAMNLAPSKFYSEGAHWPAAPTRFPCTPPACSDVIVDNLPHMSSTSAKILPPAVGGNLTVTVDLNPRVEGSAATLVVVPKVGPVQHYPIVLDEEGNGDSVPVPFTQLATSHATVTITNASIRFNCGEGTFLACHGLPLDDDTAGTFSAVVS